MEVLKDKTYKKYNRLSRYLNFPYYYNTLDDKYIGGTTKYLADDTPYTLRQIKRDDTYDSLALEYYNNPTYYWIICNFNRIADPFETPKVNSILKIPVISNIEFYI